MSKLRAFAGAAATLALLVSLTAVAPPAAAGHVNCGDVITVDTTLDADVGPCPGTGLVIGADRVILDLNGHRLFGTAGSAGEGVGVLVEGRERVWVTNGAVQHFDAGVAIVGGANNRVTRVRAIDNVGSLAAGFGDGIVAESSTGNVFEDNIIRRNGPFGGITLFGGSTHHTISRNLVQDNVVLTSPSGPQQDDGIRLENLSTDNIISENRVYDNGLDGIALFRGSARNQVVRNDVRRNGAHGQVHRQGDGIAVFNQADRNLISENRVFDNGANGIFLRGPVTFNPPSGPVTIPGARENRVLGNFTGNNGPIPGPGGPRYDLRDNNPDCDENIWLDNTYLTAFPECTTGTTGGALSGAAASGAGPSASSAPAGGPELGSDFVR
ncbi:MAG TPA: right-handed parallel beta-helix repeat-containing protein [Acidimicrobiales bacterium]|nr:right-handed parallel beta-helix repeat-containing protein [Acidimicrobiales bacterium]